MRTHDGPHDGTHDDFGCRIKQVNLAPTALGSVDASAGNEREQSWDRDIPAYRKLRAQGLQPRTVQGAAALASSPPEEVEGRPSAESVERVMDVLA